LSRILAFQPQTDSRFDFPGLDLPWVRLVSGRSSPVLFPLYQEGHASYGQGRESGLRNPCGFYSPAPDLLGRSMATACPSPVFRKLGAKNTLYGPWACCMGQPLSRLFWILVTFTGASNLVPNIFGVPGSLATTILRSPRPRKGRILEFQSPGLGLRARVPVSVRYFLDDPLSPRTNTRRLIEPNQTT
jgi:hypothetical protein